MTKRDEFGSLCEFGTDCWGFELLEAIEAQDGMKTAVILRELMYLCGWDTAQNVAFKANFRFIDNDESLQWWVAVPGSDGWWEPSTGWWDPALFQQLCQTLGREQSTEGTPLAG